MAKVKIIGADSLSKKINRNLKIELNKIIRDKSLRDKIGRIIVDDIKANVDFGSPSEGYLEWRKRYDKLNKTDKAYNRNKLNAVFTGELLEDLAKNVRGIPTELSYEVAHTSRLHKKYQGKTKKIGERIAFNKISEYLIDDLGYNYLVVTKEARVKIVKEVQEAFFKVLS